MPYMLLPQPPRDEDTYRWKRWSEEIWKLLGKPFKWLYMDTSISSDSVPTDEGVIYWDGNDRCLAYNTDKTGVHIQIGQESVIRAVNADVTSITNGMAVYISGATGNRPAIKKALSSAVTSREIIGIATADFGTTGDTKTNYVTTEGIVHDVDFSAILDSTVGLAEGDTLWVSAATAGKLTRTKPAQTNYWVQVGQVLKLTGNKGDILVRVQEEYYRFGGTADFSYFEADGTYVATGAATTWDDIYPSSVSVGVGATAPTFSAYNGGLRAYEFTGGVSNKELQVGYQIYHSYNEGSLIVPHIHVTFTSGATDAGKTIIFDLEYEWQNISATGAYSTATLQGTHTIAANNTVYRNQIISFGNLSGTNMGISSTFMTRLVRRQDLDNFTSSCWLLSADLHFEKNTIGSRQPTSK